MGEQPEAPGQTRGGEYRERCPRRRVIAAATTDRESTGRDDHGAQQGEARDRPMLQRHLGQQGEYGDGQDDAREVRGTCRTPGQGNDYDARQHGEHGRGDDEERAHADRTVPVRLGVGPNRW